MTLVCQGNADPHKPVCGTLAHHQLLGLIRLKIPLHKISTGKWVLEPNLMELRKISNCDIDCTLSAGEQLPSVRITLSEYPLCAGSEATETDPTNQRSFPAMLSAEGWGQMCKKVIQMHWVESNPGAVRAWVTWSLLGGMRLPRQDGIQLGLENKSEFNQMKKSKKASERSTCANQEPGGSMRWAAVEGGRSRVQVEKWYGSEKGLAWTQIFKSSGSDLSCRLNVHATEIHYQLCFFLAVRPGE